MLVGGDLGFSLRVVVAAFVVLFGPVVGFVVRRKWRRAEARKEEIKRLLVLASEEATLAELEATAGYGNDYGYGYSYGHDEVYGNGNGYGAVAEVEDQLSAVASGPAVAAVEVHAPVGNSQKLLYPCAVCACLTKSRCKQCKAVHYCSGKCQIIHWRQGHKNECRPYSITDHNNDLGVTSHMKVSEHEGNGSYGNDVDFEGYSSSKSVETSVGEPAFSNSSPPTVHDGENDLEVEHLVGEKGRHPNLESSNSSFHNLSASTGFSGSHNYAPHDSDGPDQHLSNKRNVEKIQTGFANIEQPKTSVSESPVLVNAIDSVDPSKSSQRKSSSVDANGNFMRSASYGLDVGGSGKSLLSEPSTLSSGFWEGKLVRNRSRTDAPEGISHSCSRGADERNVSGSQSSFSEMNKTVVSLLDTSNAKDVALDGSRPILSKIKKPTDGTSLSVEESNVDLISRKLPKLTPKKSSDFDVSSSSVKSISKPGELGPLAFGATGKLTTGAIFKENGLPSSRSKKLNYDVESRITFSEKLELKVESVSSKASEAPSSSHTERHAVRSTKAVKSSNAYGAAAFSLEHGGYQQNAKNVFKTSVLKVFDQFKASTLTKQNTSGAGSEIVARYKGLFPYELFVKLYHWNKFEFRPCGLVNCGNSCYANAVLQCLAFTPPLTAYFLQGLHSKSCQKKDWCFTCEFESLVMNAKEGTSPLSPIRIISHLQNIGSHLSNGREEDAHEFLRYAIEAMQSICLREAGIKESGSLGEETTLVGLTFGGYLRSKIECMRCGGKSERHERMMDLTVEIDGDIRTLEEALRQFTHAETLDGDNKYQCGRCKSYEKARKKLKVLEAPNVLTIVLKRFQSGKFGKLNKTIKFPEILDLAPYICGTSDKSPIYRLYGVVVHLDVMNAAFSGHYVCYVKNIQNKWYKADDSTVKAVELEKVLTKGAYMLLYARCSPRAPRLIRSSLAPRDPRKTKHHTCKPRSLSTGSLGVSAGDSSNGQACHECINSNHANSRPTGTISEEDSSSDNSSFFSEGGSCSTDSSNRDSTSTEDHFDHILGDMGASWYSPWRNSSDSDTSSSSSSLSPLFSRLSTLADSDHYASGYPETGGYADQGLDGHGFWARSATSSNLEVSDSKEDVHSSSRDSTKHFRKLGSSSRETDANRLGRINPFRRSTSERTGNIL